MTPNRCPCGATLASSPGVGVTCRHCGTAHPPLGFPFSPGAWLRPIHAVQRAAICDRCPHRSGEVCTILAARSKPGLLWHPRGLPNPSARCPAGHWSAGIVPTIPPNDEQRTKNHDHLPIAILTTHWNPHRRARLAATLADWLPHFAPLRPRIATATTPNSDEPRTTNNEQTTTYPGDVIWQKERLLNLLLADLPPSVRYVAWIDHDLIPTDPHWLLRSIDLLDSSADAVQPFDRIDYLDRSGRLDRSTPGGVELLRTGRPPTTSPGGAWIARRDYLDSIPGGIYDRHIVGGGDSTLFAAMTGTAANYLRRCAPALESHARRWLATAPTARVANLPIAWRHLWHGDRSNRQYGTRDRILARHQFDPEGHVSARPGEALRWTPEAPVALRNDIADYFADRRDDG